MPGFNERERGELLHDALEQIWSEVRDSRRLKALDTRSPRAALLARERRAAPSTSCAGAAILARAGGSASGSACTPCSRKWLASSSACARPFKVERMEQGAQIAQHAGLEFTVRIDRIDRLEDGARVLIDYKTGCRGSRLARRAARQSATAHLCAAAPRGLGRRRLWQDQRGRLPLRGRVRAQRNIQAGRRQDQIGRRCRASRSLMRGVVAAHRAARRGLRRGPRRGRPHARAPASPAGCTACAACPRRSTSPRS